MQCSKCNLFYSEDDFLKGKKWCSNCRKEYHNKWYHNTKNKRKDKIKKWRNKSREKVMRFVLNYLMNHSCVDCGESNPIVLEFDHVREKKDDEISNMIRNFGTIEKIKKEINKCEVRCANCHRIVTEKRRDISIKLDIIRSISSTGRADSLHL